MRWLLFFAITAATWSAIVQAAAAVVLVAVTYIYVHLTRRILGKTAEYVELTRGLVTETAAQSKLQYSPVIGIQVDKMYITQPYGEYLRDFGTQLTLLNLGNAPAIEINVDGEIVLQHFAIGDCSELPSRFWPKMIPFIKPNQTVTEDERNHFSPVFGFPCIVAMHEDWKRCFDEERWKPALEKVKRVEELNLWQRFNMVVKQPVLRIIVYYRNHLEQYFKSTLEVPLLLDKELNDEALEIRDGGTPSPVFHAGPISKDEMMEEMKDREKRRKLSDVRNA
jgi:hypothetical protein